MQLKLSVSSAQGASLGPDAVARFRLRGGTIGRARDNDWVLPDPERIVSGHHARILYEQGGYYLEDTSSNGTFLNGQDSPLPPGQLNELQHGDLLSIGDYEIRVELEEDTASSADSWADLPRPPPQAPDFVAKPYAPPADASYQPATPAHPPAADDRADDPWASQRYRASTQPQAADHWAGVQRDHLAPDAINFQPPSASPELIPSDGVGEAPSDILPDDWWKIDDDPADAPAFSPPGPPAVEQQPLPDPLAADPFEIEPSTQTSGRQSAAEPPPPAAGAGSDSRDAGKSTRTDASQAQAVAGQPQSTPLPTEPIPTPQQPAETDQAAQVPPQADLTPQRPPATDQATRLPPEVDQIPEQHPPAADQAAQLPAEADRPPPAPSPPPQPAADAIQGAPEPAQPRPAAEPTPPASQHPAPQHPASQHPAPQHPAPQHPASQHPASQTTAPSPAPPPPASQPQLAPSDASSPAAASALLAAFYDGLGLQPPADLTTAQAERELRHTGRLLRILTDGLMEVLKTRSTLKGEFRLSQTIVQSAENNPLKFCIDAQQALTQLFVDKRPGFMAPEASFSEALTDVKQHQIAVIAGMRAAFDCLIDKFDPETIDTARKAAGKRRGALLSDKQWAFYRDYHADFKANAGDDFQGIFGEDFVRAYEAQIRRLMSGGGNDV